MALEAVLTAWTEAVRLALVKEQCRSHHIIAQLDTWQPPASASVSGTTRTCFCPGWRGAGAPRRKTAAARVRHRNTKVHMAYPKMTVVCTHGLLRAGACDAISHTINCHHFHEVAHLRQKFFLQLRQVIGTNSVCLQLAKLQTFFVVGTFGTATLQPLSMWSAICAPQTRPESTQRTTLFGSSRGFTVTAACAVRLRHANKCAPCTRDRILPCGQECAS